jgi:predicted Zn-dependent peptidase
MKILNVNGTKVVYHYLPSKLTNIQILTNCGSANENKEEQGYAHILEHNFFRGSKNYPFPADIQTAANDIGGKLNAWTHYDVTNYHITVLNDFFRKGFDILADMYQYPLFPEEEFIKELNPILSEMRRGEDNPDGYLGHRLLSAMVGEEAGHSVIGTEESVKASTVEKIQTFRKRYYGGNNTMLSIVGGVTEEEVIKVVSDLFILPPASDQPKVPVVEYKNGEMKLYKPGITEAVYSLCYPALPRFHKDRYKQGLMTYVLGGNDSGMFFERIREQLALSCYGIYASQMHFDSHNIIEVSTGIAPEQLEQCHEEVLGQIKKIMNEKIDDKRLARAKASLRTSIAAASENSGGYNSSISISILKGMAENPLEKLLTGIEDTTIGDIQRLAQETFSIEPYKGILLPEEIRKEV